jgi:hypothetical protein
MTQRLIGGTEVARLLNVTPSAVTNWRKRGTGPLPEPAYEYKGRRPGYWHPLWTPEQVAPIIQAHIAEVEAKLAELEARSAP